MKAKRPPPFFIADNPGPDFLNSVAVPEDTKVDWLASGEDLLRWLKQAGLVPGDVLNAFRKDALPGELDGVGAQARALRDWFKPFVYKYMGRPIGPEAMSKLELLNQILARDEEFEQIAIHRRRYDRDTHGPKKTRTSNFALRRLRRWHSPASLLIPLAQSLADLVCTEDFTNIKACKGPDCELLFVDRTRDRSRKSCSALSCRNRAQRTPLRRLAQRVKKRSY
jgi:predicted RNA-binding Zn ribbon-like protein